MLDIQTAAQRPRRPWRARLADRGRSRSTWRRSRRSRTERKRRADRARRSCRPRATARQAGSAQAKAKGEDAARADGRGGRAQRRARARWRSGSTASRRGCTTSSRVIPNVPHAVGAGRAGRRTTTSRCAASATPREFDFAAKDHVDVGAALGMLDFDAAAKIAGARFVRDEGRARAPAPRARAVHARRAHARSTATPRSTCPTW